MKDKITVIRKSTESEITVVLYRGPVVDDYRQKINTPIVFLNHMLEHVVWRSGYNLEIDVKLDRFDLSHVVAEDAGMTVGKAVAEFVKKNVPQGYGDAIGIIDEAKASCAISFEGRALFDFTSKLDIPAVVEGAASEDVKTFLDGFVQGAGCTLHIDVEKGENGHHIWEAAYRALGIALGRALNNDVNRVWQTAGVAGKVTYEVK